MLWVCPIDVPCMLSDGRVCFSPNAAVGTWEFGCCFRKVSLVPLAAELRSGPCSVTISDTLLCIVVGVCACYTCCPGSARLWSRDPRRRSTLLKTSETLEYKSKKKALGVERKGMLSRKGVCQCRTSCHTAYSSTGMRVSLWCER